MSEYSTACRPEECERIVDCTVCHRRKPPRGRDVPAEMHGSYCEHECPGYYREPRSGHLWPGELARGAGTEGK